MGKHHSRTKLAKHLQRRAQFTAAASDRAFLLRSQAKRWQSQPPRRPASPIINPVNLQEAKL